ncbi:NAD(P)/FAD-dependent oxidoreductase [uncultured Anaerococcus sp.]|uniref:NAD(P)/FAD-dependent oxidoreductase n=1 Tax=uncultured Anaerococcus sp. TaxID=293428 RepID=UPI00260EA2AD|nr:NAD(P)/FAD-dependent oxidoreductase [uncultured Anaerococcus sp.]
MKDLIIIGAGPCGVSAALYAQSRGCDLTIFEKEQVGGLIGKVSKVSHYTSVIVDEDGESFRKRLENQIKAYGLDLRYEEVTKLEKKDAYFLVTTNKGSYEAKKVIVAAGSTPKELDLDSKGYEIAHWARGSEERVSGKVVLVNGGSDGACKEALYLSKFAKEVHIIQNQEALMCINEFRKQIEASSNITVHTGVSLTSIDKDGDHVCKASLSNGEEIKSQEGLEVFAMIGQYPNTGFIDIDLSKNDLGFIVSDIKTPIEGLFVAGDIRVKAVKQVATAVNDGALAGIEASK